VLRLATIRDSRLFSQRGACSADLNFAPIEKCRRGVTRSAAEYHKAFEEANANGGARLTSASVAEVKPPADPKRAQADELRRVAQSPLVQASTLCAGFYTGYSVKTVPPCGKPSSKAVETGGRSNRRGGWRVERRSGTHFIAAAKLAAK